MAGPSLLGRIWRRHKQNLAELFSARDEHQRAAGLRDGRQVEEIIFLPERPIHIACVVSWFGSVENQDSLFADLLDCGFAARGEIGHTVALPGSWRRRRNFPDAGIGCAS